MQIGFGRIGWSDGSVSAGGAFGVLLADLLQARLNFVGTLVVLFSVVACGTALVVQSTLGDLLAAAERQLELATGPQLVPATACRPVPQPSRR